MVVPKRPVYIAWFALAAVIGIGILSGWSLVPRPSGAAAHRRCDGRHCMPVGRRRVIGVVTILLALTFSKNFYMAAFASYYTFFMIERFGVSVGSAQVHLFLFLGAVAVGTLLGGPIGDRIEPQADPVDLDPGRACRSASAAVRQPVLDRRPGGADRA